MEEKQKILIFSTAYYPFVGGAEVAIKEITDRLPAGEAGIPDMEFDLITARMRRNLSKEERIGNIGVYRVGIGVPIIDKLLLPFWGALKTVSLNKKNKYSAYWCMMVTFASGAAYLANILEETLAIFGRKNLSSGEAGVPIVLTLQEGDSEEYLKTKWFGLIDLSWRLALRRSAVVTVISEYLGERAKRLGYEGEIKMIPNGVDAGKYEGVFAEEELQDLRDRLNGDENVVILLSTSRLVEKNGLDLVVRALPHLPENFRFYNFGSGRDKKKLLDLAASLGVSARVYLQDYVDHDELPKYLQIADIFIRPSRSEGQGISFLEAMAAKIPVIATPVGGIVDFLFDPSNTSGQVATGYFCETENPESIALTVQRALNDPHRGQVVENAYKMVCEKYDWDEIAKRMGEVLRN